jgi:hypothetical protein
MAALMHRAVSRKYLTETGYPSRRSLPGRFAPRASGNLPKKWKYFSKICLRSHPESPLLFANFKTSLFSKATLTQSI